MNSATQVLLVIASFILALSVLVGLILISTSLFQIKGLIRTKNKLLLQRSRPYVICRRIRKQTIEIRNVGNSPARIDEIESDTVDFSYLNQKDIFSGQFFNYPIAENQDASIFVKYHDQINHFEEKFTV
ncbi:hypothetical protein [Companilactobacillus bobalius]|uniref:Uncharacterized protein n=2 Tax=Companilactobacillus bobalius TaxID=2801451 RepID=A0A202FEQ1_9LACO|nr:hypothetical protein [Companilactobacillus bobalius]KAE9560600.1 hypothetical protein ATN92_10700 [Companilactobacillus bobalius]KRK83377.1 hypothetical protein FC78_GL002189 [Companilactobacillus bobalius DSM 19674]OVE98928.1 hypothetical protein LKACC16343_00040 [Companilactobacillus bobalius]GEO56904.1 hypothetical protein LBO01_00330 [Companilactobacillus paralimentarius]